MRTKEFEMNNYWIEYLEHVKQERKIEAIETARLAKEYKEGMGVPLTPNYRPQYPGYLEEGFWEWYMENKMETK